ncbi:hypothetical protein [Agromyces sp. NPDC058126]|uniref:hypothetical protein n=1 Tax=Agromyces sp. NPDC058126 TaxID=3346350 RepID=UPI0036D80845
MTQAALAERANTYARTVSIVGADPGVPWYVRLADDAHVFRLVCFDFDVKDRAGRVLDELVEKAGEDCDRLAGFLDELDIAHVVCESSGTGGRHVWLALLSGAPAPLVASLGRAAKVVLSSMDAGMLFNPATGGVRPPGAPHRDGSASRVLAGDLRSLAQPTTTVEQLEKLTERLREVAPAEQVEREPVQGRLERSYRPARQMHPNGVAHLQTAGGGADPSRTGFICLLFAASAGWTFQEVTDAVRTAPGLEHYRTRHLGAGRRRPRAPHELVSKLEKDWARALEIHELRTTAGTWQPSTRPAPDVAELQAQLQTIEDLRVGFQIHPGRWGAEDGGAMRRSILVALAYLTLHTGRTHVAASTRTIALLIGTGKSQVAHHLNELRTEGLLARAQAADGTDAAVWALRPEPRLSTPLEIHRTLPPEGSQQATPPARPSEVFAERRRVLGELESELLQVRHDLFSYRTGLGQTGARAWVLLEEHGGLSTRELAHLLGSSEVRAERIVQGLRGLKLIFSAGQRWRRYVRDVRTAAAKTLNVFGTLVRRAARYAFERELWAWWCDHARRLQGKAPRTRPSYHDARGRTLSGADVPLRDRLFPRYPTTYDGRADYPAARARVRDGAVYSTGEYFAVRVELDPWPDDAVETWPIENLHGTEPLNNIRTAVGQATTPPPPPEPLQVPDYAWTTS